jgi:glycosyltransferase involved in cell wall biosynthesis
VSRRTVLMVTYHFPPSSASGAFRLLGFARHLPKHDWRAAVVSAPTIPWEPVDHALSALIPPETALYPVPYTKSRVVRRLAQYSGWLPRALLACERAIREQKPEAVLTSGPPHQVHWLGLWLKRRHGLSWIADFRDPWFPAGTVDPRLNFASWRIHAQEAAIFGAADLVIANTPGACRVLSEDHPRFRSKFMTLTNGYDPEAFESAPRVSAGPPRIVHTGAIYWGRNPRPFLDAVKSLTEDGTAILVDLYGPPPESHLDLGEEVRSRGLANCVTNHGQIPYAQCVRAMVGADILLLMDSPGKTVGVPAKLYEYLGAGRPILAIAERGGDVEWVLDRSGVPHRIVPPGEPESLAPALAGLIHEIQDAPCRRGDSHVFSREFIAGQLAERLDQLTGQGRRATASERAVAVVGGSS